jgi:hypothetical protein
MLTFIEVPLLRQSSQFKRRHGKGFWKQRENRRQFLIDLATSKGLDPFDPATWDIITPKDLLRAKV